MGYNPPSFVVVNGLRLLLLALQPGHEHLLGPLGDPLVVLDDRVEELHKLLVTLLLQKTAVALTFCVTTAPALRAEGFR